MRASKGFILGASGSCSLKLLSSAGVSFSEHECSAFQCWQWCKMCPNSLRVNSCLDISASHKSFLSVQLSNIWLCKTSHWCSYKNIMCPNVRRETCLLRKIKLLVNFNACFVYCVETCWYCVWSRSVSRILSVSALAWPFVVKK